MDKIINSTLKNSHDMVTHTLSPPSSLWQCNEINVLSSDPNWPPPPNKINTTPCTLYYTEKMTIYPKVATVDTTNLQLGDIFHLEFSFYNITTIFKFNSILTVVCDKTIMLWILPTTSNQSPVIFIRFILKNWRINYFHANVWELMMMDLC